jgi:hypothetical protein
MIPVLESGSLWDIKTQSLGGIISLKCQCSLSPFVIRHPLSSYSVSRLSCCASAQCSVEVSVQGVCVPANGCSSSYGMSSLTHWHL